MAANLATRADGSAMMAYAGAVPWHKMGVSVGDDNVDSETMKEASGLGWRTGKRPVLFSVADLTPGAFGLVNSADIREFADKYVTFREDTGAPLGVVGRDYKVFNNEECFAWMDALAANGIRYHTAGALGNGSRVWIAGVLEDVLTVKADVIGKYILLSTSHDGTLKLTVRPTPVRVVCQNTWTRALRGSKDRSSIVEIRHSGNMTDKLGEARRILGITNTFFDDLSAVVNKMADVRVTREQTRQYIDRVFGAGSVRAKNVGDRVLTLATSGMGNDSPEIAGTVYAAYQGVTEYLTHEKLVSGTAEKTPEEQMAARVDSGWFGGFGDQNADAFALASKMADDLYSAPTVFSMS